MNKHIKRAIEIVGGQTELAKAVGGTCKQQHVWNWLHRDTEITLENALKIERATGGKVTQAQLRPDLFPAEKVSA